MFGHGHQNRGQTTVPLPSNRPEIFWTYQTDGPIFSSPVVFAPNRVAVGSHDKNVYFFDLSGTLLWRHKTGDLIFGSPAVSASGTLFIGSDDDHLYALALNKSTQIWRYRVGNCPANVGIGPLLSKCDVDGGPTIGPYGRLYTGGDGIYAIEPDGKLAWKYLANGHISTTPALLSDGTVVAGAKTTPFTHFIRMAACAGPFELGRHRVVTDG